MKKHTTLMALALLYSCCTLPAGSTANVNNQDEFRAEINLIPEFMAIQQRREPQLNIEEEQESDQEELNEPNYQGEQWEYIFTNGEPEASLTDESDAAEKHIDKKRKQPDLPSLAAIFQRELPQAAPTGHDNQRNVRRRLTYPGNNVTPSLLPVNNEPVNNSNGNN